MRSFYSNLLLAAFSLIISVSALSQANISGTVNSYHSVTSISGNDVVVTSAAGLAVNDEVLLIQMTGITGRGIGGGTDNGAGNFVITTITGVSGTTITLDTLDGKTFTPASEFVQLVEVSSHTTDVQLTGNVTGTAWNGSTGGVIAIKTCGNTLDLNGFDIDATGLGFFGRNSTFTTSSSSCGENDDQFGNDENWGTDPTYFGGVVGTPGGPSGATGRGGHGGCNGVIYTPAGGGGVGSHGAISTLLTLSSGGGGGGYGGGGSGGGTFNGSVTGSDAPPVGNTFATAYNLRMFMGGAGGSEEEYATESGNGGGIIILIADSLDGSAGSEILANGEEPPINTVTWDASNTYFIGAGSGGAGYIITTAQDYVSPNISIEAIGGSASANDNSGNTNEEFGGPGGGGLIMSAYNIPEGQTDFSAGTRNTGNNAMDGAEGAFLNDNLIDDLLCRIDTDGDGAIDIYDGDDDNDGIPDDNEGCEIREGWNEKLDWDSETWSGNSNTFTLTNLTVDVNVTSTGSPSRTTTLAQTVTGGQSPAEDGLYSTINFADTTETVTFSFDFSDSLNFCEFALWDVDGDYGGDQRHTDEVYVQGFFNGVAVTPLVTSTFYNQINGAKLEGVNFSAGSTVNYANGYVSFISTIDSFTVRYKCAASTGDADGNPNTGDFSISDVFFEQYPTGNCTIDTDLDGILDNVDLDADNDGIPDIVEAGGEDTDGDGTVDVFTDTDNDGIPDKYDADNGGDAITNGDSDGDGIIDSKDLDSDNDGIPDVVEAGGTDTDGDGVFDDQTDTDGDGFADDVDGDVGNDGTAENSVDALVLTDADGDNDGIPDSYPANDTDDDGVLDYLDLDSDNDGIPDVVEAGGTDTDGDGRFDNQTDTDLDGFADDVDGDIGNDGTAENSGDALQVTGADTDNDGAPNSYPNDDTDGDGIRDQLDLDADNDGIPDVVEAGGTDTDGDGYFDDQTDTDGDGFADDVDGDVGNDGTAENSGDALQLTGADTDNDGAPNSFPSDDTDGDNIPNQLDLDADNDGIPDVVEAGGTDTDGDGIFDDAGTDTDGDGFADDVDGDVGNDGTAENSGDALSVTGADTDNDGAPNSFPSDDTDGDDIVDYLDLDADNDGIPDVVEAGGTDTDGDGFFDDQTDTDGDGFADEVDGDVGNDGTAENSGDALQLTGADNDNDGAPNSYPNDDTDGDGIRDQLDLDADNDGIPDVVEAGGTDTDGDGIFDDAGTDTDGDGFADDVDGDVGNDGTAENSGDALQLTGADTDNDGAPNSFPSDDTDGDNIPNQLDIDSDGDGITDVLEAGGIDADTDGRIDNNSTDTDGDGFADGVDGDVGNDGTAENSGSALTLTGSDTDNDGAPNSLPNDDADGDDLHDFYDIDADNDGIVDNSEGQTTAGFVSPSGTDTDGDGLDDAYDADCSPCGAVTGDYIDPVDTEADGTDDYLDSDSDNDGIPDSIEGHDTNGNFAGDSGSPASSGVSGGATDADNDGLLDGWDNNTSTLDADNGALTPTSHPDLTNTSTTERDWREARDSDNDGIADIIDLDDDNDGIPDIDEAGANQPDGDEDGDGILNFIDTSDGGAGDGSTTDYTDSNGDGIPDVYDFDEDGVPNHLDKDSDNDGIADIIEAGGTDTNSDGEVDYPTPGDATTMTDADNDGLDDNRDDVDSGSGGGEVTSGTPWAETNTDGSGNPDYLDIDADDDGIVDNTEGQTTAGYISPAGTDSDFDGIDDAYDPDNGGTYISPVNTESTGNPDYQDTDSDDDGENDVIEGHDSNGDGIADSGSPADSGVSGGSTDADGDGLLDGFDNDPSDPDPTNGSLTPTSHPNEDEGGTERDWREVPCQDGDVTLAPNNTTTTASDFCVDGDWTYYYSPADPTELLFAVERTPAGGNSNDVTISVDLTVSSNPTTESGVYSNEDAVNGNATFVMGRYYNITLTGTLNGFVNVRFYYDTDESDTLAAVADRWNDDNAGSTANVSGLRWFTMNSGTFDPGTTDLLSTGVQGSSEQTPTATSTEDGVNFAQFQLTSLTGGGLGYTVGTNSVVLPVTWLSFEATKNDVWVDLEWITGTERNTSSFVVEHMNDFAQEWSELEQVKAAGESQSPIVYSTKHFEPSIGNNYYRIRQIDLDESFTFSDARVVAFDGQGVVPGEAVAYPIPSTGQVFVKLPQSEGSFELRVLDQQGMSVWAETVQAENGIIQIDVPVASGMYSAELIGVSKTYSVRFIIAR